MQLLFGNVAEVEAVRFPAALDLEHPLLVFYSASPVSNPSWQPFSSQNATLAVDFYVRHRASGSGAQLDAPQYALRIQSFAPGGEFVKFQSLLPRGAAVAACEEMTLTFQEPRAKVCIMCLLSFTFDPRLTRAEERRRALAVADARTPASEFRSTTRWLR
jgi:hypothetical protein